MEHELIDHDVVVATAVVLDQAKQHMAVPRA
jgi:hypothetical protein